MSRSLLVCLAMTVAVAQPVPGNQKKAPFRLLYK